METKMRNFAVMGASALVLALSVGGASAQPGTDQLLNAGDGATFQSSTAVQSNTTIIEGRATAPFADYQPGRHSR
jgi:hypothetical protein